MSKVLVSLLLMSIGTFHTSATHAQWFGYKTFEECINKELQKYKDPTETAASAVILYCEADFEKRADKKIRQRFLSTCPKETVDRFMNDLIEVTKTKMRAEEALAQRYGDSKLNCPTY